MVNLEMSKKISRREFLQNASIGVVGVSALGLGGCFHASKRRPNFILILADDLGWADTSVQMSPKWEKSYNPIQQTPNLQRLSEKGMTFSQAYAASPVCSPTRDAVLTGKTPTRLHHSILLGKMDYDENSPTIPKILKGVDPAYITAHFGKWGCTPKEPEDGGYDVSDGDTDNWHGDWRYVDGEKTTLPVDDPKRIFSVTKTARNFMREQVATDRPFFMQISHYAAHVGHLALPETIKKYEDLGLEGNSAVYAAMIEDMDTGLGGLIDEMKALGITENTYFIFTSDNGGDFWEDGPLRGGKATLWEGGIRIPTIISGPGIAAGSRCVAPIAQWDFLPTIKALAGDETPLSPEFDGGDISPLLFKQQGKEIVRGTKDLIFYYPWFDSLPMACLIREDFKLVQDLNTKEARLFDLSIDIGENTDVTSEHPDLASNMLMTLENYLKDVKAEDLEELRVNRETDLREWTIRDKAIRKDLKEKIARTSDETELEALSKELQFSEKLIINHTKALERVRVGRLRRAWEKENLQ
jgi:arylsulfatase A